MDNNPDSTRTDRALLVAQVTNNSISGSQGNTPQNSGLVKDRSSSHVLPKEPVFAVGEVVIFKEFSDAVEYYEGEVAKVREDNKYVRIRYDDDDSRTWLRWISCEDTFKKGSKSKEGLKRKKKENKMERELLRQEMGEGAQEKEAEEDAASVKPEDRHEIQVWLIGSQANLERYEELKRLGIKRLDSPPPPVENSVISSAQGESPPPVPAHRRDKRKRERRNTDGEEDFGDKYNYQRDRRKEDREEQSSRREERARSPDEARHDPSRDESRVDKSSDDFPQNRETEELNFRETWELWDERERQPDRARERQSEKDDDDSDKYQRRHEIEGRESDNFRHESGLTNPDSQSSYEMRQNDYARDLRDLRREVRSLDRSAETEPPPYPKSRDRRRASSGNSVDPLGDALAVLDNLENEPSRHHRSEPPVDDVPSIPNDFEEHPVATSSTDSLARELAELGRADHHLDDDVPRIPSLSEVKNGRKRLAEDPLDDLTIETWLGKDSAIERIDALDKSDRLRLLKQQLVDDNNSPSHGNIHQGELDTTSWRQWSVLEVAEWIRTQGGPEYEEYATKFIENEIRGADLCEVDTKALKEDLEIKNFAARKKIMNAIYLLRGRERNGSAPLTEENLKQLETALNNEVESLTEELLDMPVDTPGAEEVMQLDEDEFNQSEQPLDEIHVETPAGEISRIQSPNLTDDEQAKHDSTKDETIKNQMDEDSDLQWGANQKRMEELRKQLEETERELQRRKLARIKAKDKVREHEVKLENNNKALGMSRAVEERHIEDTERERRQQEKVTREKEKRDREREREREKKKRRKQEEAEKLRAEEGRLQQARELEQERKIEKEKKEQRRQKKEKEKDPLADILGWDMAQPAIPATPRTTRRRRRQQMLQEVESRKQQLFSTERKYKERQRQMEIERKRIVSELTSMETEAQQYASFVLDPMQALTSMENAQSLGPLSPVMVNMVTKGGRNDSQKENVIEGNPAHNNSLPMQDLTSSHPLTDQKSKPQAASYPFDETMPVAGPKPRKSERKRGRDRPAEPDITDIFMKHSSGSRNRSSSKGRKPPRDVTVESKKPISTVPSFADIAKRAASKTPPPVRDLSKSPPAERNPITSPIGAQEPSAPSKLSIDPDPLSFADVLRDVTQFTKPRSSRAENKRSSRKNGSIRRRPTNDTKVTVTKLRSPTHSGSQEGIPPLGLTTMPSRQNESRNNSRPRRSSTGSTAQPGSSRRRRPHSSNNTKLPSSTSKLQKPKFPSSSSKPPRDSRSPFNLRDVYNYLGATAPPEKPANQGDVGSSIKIDSASLFKYHQQQRPLPTTSQTARLPVSRSIGPRTNVSSFKSKTYRSYALRDKIDSLVTSNKPPGSKLPLGKPSKKSSVGKPTKQPIINLTDVQLANLTPKLRKQVLELQKQTNQWDRQRQRAEPKPRRRSDGMLYRYMPQMDHNRQETREERTDIVPRVDSKDPGRAGKNMDQYTVGERVSVHSNTRKLWFHDGRVREISKGAMHVGYDNGKYHKWIIAKDVVTSLRPRSSRNSKSRQPSGSSRRDPSRDRAGSRRQGGSKRRKPESTGLWGASLGTYLDKPQTRSRSQSKPSRRVLSNDVKKDLGGSRKGSSKRTGDSLDQKLEYLLRTTAAVVNGDQDISVDKDYTKGKSSDPLMNEINALLLPGGRNFSTMRT